MSNMCIFKIPEEEGRMEQKIFEKILSNNFPKLRKDSKPHIHKAQRTLGKINKHKTKTSQHIICKLLNIKNKNNHKGSQTLRPLKRKIHYIHRNKEKL